MKFVSRMMIGMVLAGAAGLLGTGSPSAISAVSSQAESPPTLSAILDKYVQALGGKEAIEKIRSRRFSGTLVHEFPGQEPPKLTLPAEVIAAAPDKWRLILTTSSGIQQMGFDGKRGFTQDADRILVDARQARSRLAYLFSPQGPLRFEEYFPHSTFQGKVVTEGREEFEVKARDSAGNETSLFFDTKSGLLVRLGENISVRDYRRVEEVLHPALIAIARRGGSSTYIFDGIEVGAAFEDARFAVPNMEDVFPDAFAGLGASKVLPLLKNFPSTHEEMSVPCRDGRFLYDMILQNGYKRGLEIGTFTGYSTLWLGWAFSQNGGKLITLEVDPGPGEKARQNIRSAGLGSVVDARIADALAEIPRIEGEFDFVFIDAWKPDYVKYLKLVRDRVPVGGVIVAHNVTNYAHDMEDFLAAIKKDSALETTFEELSEEGMSVSKVRPAEPPPPDVPPAAGRPSARPGPSLFSVEDMRHDFLQLRRILETEHCCLYEYTGKTEFDSLFESRLALIDKPMRYEEFFRIAAPLAAKVGCMHTALWMPGRFFNLESNNLFPLRVKLIEDFLVVVGSYRDSPEVPVGSVILEINGLPAGDIFNALRAITSADALNPYFIDTQVEKRFPMFYASVYGFPDRYTVTYALPGGETRLTADLRPADLKSVREVIFANFEHPPLTIDFLEAKSTAVMTVKTFIYYDRVDYFRDFMSRSFRQIREKGIENLILDLRGNDGGDPFCAVILYSYLEKEPAPYFAEPYGRYAELAKPVPLPDDRFTGRLFILLDGRCGSTNGHFSALLKYHRIGKFVGTPSGSTYKCNAGKNTEFTLDKTSLILTLGRSTYAAAVEGMDKAKPIMPDFPVQVTYQDFLDGKDPYLETALRIIEDTP